MRHDCRSTACRGLVTELLFLHEADPGEDDETLLTHRWILSDFLEYNEFIGIAEATVEELSLEGEIQVASFHPQFQLAASLADDISNFTNRSPYSTLHLLREASIDRAVAAFPDAEEIFSRNVETLRRLGITGWKLLEAYDSMPNSSRNNEKQ